MDFTHYTHRLLGVDVGDRHTDGHTDGYRPALPLCEAWAFDVKG